MVFLMVGIGLREKTLLRIAAAPKARRVIMIGLVVRGGAVLATGPVERGVDEVAAHERAVRDVGVVDDPFVDIPVHVIGAVVADAFRIVAAARQATA